MSDRIRAALDKAAEEVLKNLKDRHGLRQAIEQCDADVQAEIGKTVAAVGNAAFLRTYSQSDASLWLADAVLAASKED